MKLRRAIGIGFVVFGALNIIDLASPLIPTIGVQAIVVGGVCIAAGAYLMRSERGAAGGSTSRLGSLLSVLREGRRASAKPRRPIDPLLPVRTLRLAKQRGGSLTVSAVAMALEVGLDDAQEALDELVRKGAASADVDLGTGIATYRFPEFLPPPEGPDARP